MNNLVDWQKRVVEEKKELSIKIDGLRAFLRGQEANRTLDPTALMLIQRQHWAMNLYEACLTDRIEQF